MFNPEKAISDWRRRMLGGGVKSPRVLDELESHLREDMSRQLQSGLCAEEAFKSAERQIGEADALKTEFAKTGRTFLPIHSFRETVLAAGPACGFYLKASALLLPAAFVWLFSVVFLMPKLREICQAAGMTLFNVGNAPAIFRVWAKIGQLMVFLTANDLLIGCAVVLACIVLEWRSAGWRRYRRATVGAGIFVFNFAVLLSLTLMVISAVLASSNLMSHSK